MGQNIRQAALFYGSGTGFSGQRFALELIAQGLHERNWQIKVVNTPLRDRIIPLSWSTKISERIYLATHLLIAWIKGLKLTLKSTVLIIGLGQTKFALIRDGFPLLIKGLFTNNNPAILTLNGSLIMSWTVNSFEAKFLRKLVRSASYITVVGPHQKVQLESLEIPNQKIVIVDNTCNLLPTIKEEVILKHSLIPNRPMQVLYLSSLIEAKGYPEFIEAIAKLSQEATSPVEVVLCGKITVMDADTRFKTTEEATLWIETQINQINQSQSVRIRWIKGAIGKLKENLFKEAHVFVLPSRYKVEAQPIAIIEALASGCAVITSKVGEIPTMVSNRTAILLDQVSTNTIAESIILLQHNVKMRQSLATEGLNLFQTRFTYQDYINRWENLLLKTIGNH